MKPLIAAVILLLAVWLAFAPAAQKIRTAIGGVVSSLHLPSVPNSPSAPDAVSIADARKFELTLEHVRPGGQAYASGSYFDVPPTATTFPERLKTSDANSKAAIHVFISGLPDGMVDGQTWTGWLVRSGTTQYRDGNGDIHVTAGYRVIPAPPSVDPQNKPGSWMEEKGRTAIDQPAKSTHWH